MTYAAVETSQRGGQPVELYRFTVGTLATYWYTSADVAQSYNGDTYTPAVISRGELSHSGEDSSGGIEVSLPRESPILQHFVAYSPEPAMALTVFRKHRTDADTIVLWTGTVSSAVLGASRGTLTGVPILALLRRKIPRNTYSTLCYLDLYGSECSIAKATFAVAGTVTTITGATVQASAWGAKPDGWFTNGYVERFNGERRWIVGHVGSTLTLMSPFVGLTVGESLTAYAGCDRSEATCQSKFSNIANHRGWSRIPTKNPFAGGLA